MLPFVAARQAEIAELCRRYGVRRLELFGSAAFGNFDRHTSDLDFIVLFDVLPPGERFNAFFGLKEGLEALFARPVDLLTEESIVNPYLRATIDASRTSLYVA